MSTSNKGDEGQAVSDRFKVGNITGSSGVAIGREARAEVHIKEGAAREVDPGQLRQLLNALYDAIDRADLPRDVKRKALTAADNAVDQGVEQDEVKPQPLLANLQKVGEVLQQSNETVSQTTSLVETIQKLAKVAGPLVGGTHVVAQMFGLPI